MRHYPPTPTLQSIKIPGQVYDQMRATVDIIGKAIKDGSRYLPIRNRAAALASRARPKDYLGQINEIFDDFVKRWRYVKDPVGKELVTTSPQQLFHLVMGGRSNDPGVGLGRGAGDCDDAACAIGAQLAAIGIPVRICTISPQGAPPGRLMSHVFVQGQVSGLGWITVDPVVFPKHGMGYTPPHSRMAIFDLEGNFLEGSGNLTNMAGGYSGLGEMETKPMCNCRQFRDMAGFGDYAGAEEDILDFRRYGVKDFGIYADTMGIMDLGEYGGMNLAAEVDTDERGYAWTPILEMAPADYNYIRETGRPYQGMLALGDNLEVYSYDGNLGFFKKLFRKAKKGLKKIGKKAKSLAKKLLKKLPGGKYLLKLGKKLWKVSKKLLAPLTKFVGKYAAKLAPIAALIPGYGTAIAAGLYTAGKVAKLMNKFGVKVTKKKGDPVGKVKFKSGAAGKAFQKALKKAAKAEKKKGKRVDGKRRGSRGGRPMRVGRGRRPMIKRGRRRPVGRRPMRAAR